MPPAPLPQDRSDAVVPVQICHGYEDANDCDTMRHDAALKAAAGRTPADGPFHLPLNSPAAPLFVRTAQISAAVLKT